jgi:hypothetical protein
MKKQLESLVGMGKTAINDICGYVSHVGKSAKNLGKIGLTGVVLAASPYLMEGKVSAQEGRLEILYRIDSQGQPYTNSWLRVFHSSDGNEELDIFDQIYSFPPSPSGITSKTVSEVGGMQLVGDVRPINSTSTVYASYSVINEQGGPIPEINQPRMYLSVSNPFSGKTPFEGKDVFVTIEGNTYNAKEHTDAIPLTQGLSGTATISFNWVTQPPIEPPINPPIEPPINPPIEPPINPPINPPITPGINTPPRAFPQGAEDALMIQNYVGSLSNSNQGSFVYLEGNRNLHGIDPNDVKYVKPPTTSSKIISFFPSTSRGVYNELINDARPSDDYTKPVLLETSVSSPWSNQTISGANELRFWLANQNAFGDKPITIQRLETNPESNIVHPVWDVRQIIAKNNRTMPLANLVGLQANKPYATFHLSTNTDIYDLNGDNKIDRKDYEILQAEMGKTGPSRADIARTRNGQLEVGLPDGRVDESDRQAFIIEHNRLNPNNQIITETPVQPGFFADFQNGSLGPNFTTWGASPWFVTSENGNFVARSGEIGDNETSVLETVPILAKEGKVSFDIKTSTENNFDVASAYINNELIGTWSGEKDWQTVTSNVTPGTQVRLKVEYKKDGSVDVGNDAVLIDNVRISKASGFDEWRRFMHPEMG